MNHGGDIQDLIAYADSKGVGLILWYNSGGPHNQVPVAWDETQYIEGIPGEWVVMARRKKQDWYTVSKDDTLSLIMAGRGGFSARCVPN